MPPSVSASSSSPAASTDVNVGGDAADSTGGSRRPATFLRKGPTSGSAGPIAVGKQCGGSGDDALLHRQSGGLREVPADGAGRDPCANGRSFARDTDPRVPGSPLSPRPQCVQRGKSGPGSSGSPYTVRKYYEEPSSCSACPPRLEKAPSSDLPPPIQLAYNMCMGHWYGNGWSSPGGVSFDPVSGRLLATGGSVATPSRRCNPAGAGWTRESGVLRDHPLRPAPRPQQQNRAVSRLSCAGRTSLVARASTSSACAGSGIIRAAVPIRVRGNGSVGRASVNCGGLGSASSGALSAATRRGVDRWRPCTTTPTKWRLSRSSC